MFPVFAQSYQGALCEALCEGSMRIKLRSELYAKGALCGSTEGPALDRKKKKSGWGYLPMYIERMNTLE